MGYLRQSSPGTRLFMLLAMFFSFMIIAGILSVVLFPLISNGLTPDSINDPAAASQPAFIRAMQLMQIIYTIVCFVVPALLIARMSHPRPAEYLGLRAANRADQLILAILIMLISLPLVGVTADWNKGLDLPAFMKELDKLAEEQTKFMLNMPDVPSLLVGLFIIAVLPALAEELFFRGVMQRLLTQITRKGWVAILITSLFFSAIHFQFGGYLPRVVLSVLLGAIFYLTGNLWLSIAGHFVNNGLQVVLMYLFQTKVITYDVMTEEKTPVYYGIISLAVAGFLLVLLYKRAKAAGYTIAVPQDAREETIIDNKEEDSIFKDI